MQNIQRHLICELVEPRKESRSEPFKHLEKVISVKYIFLQMCCRKKKLTFFKENSPCFWFPSFQFLVSQQWLHQIQPPSEEHGTENNFHSKIPNLVKASQCLKVVRKVTAGWRESDWKKVPTRTNSINGSVDGGDGDGDSDGGDGSPRAPCVLSSWWHFHRSLVAKGTVPQDPL